MSWYFSKIKEKTSQLYGFYSTNIQEFVNELKTETEEIKQQMNIEDYLQDLKALNPFSANNQERMEYDFDSPFLSKQAQSKVVQCKFEELLFEKSMLKQHPAEVEKFQLYTASIPDFPDQQWLYKAGVDTCEDSQVLKVYQELVIDSKEVEPQNFWKRYFFYAQKIIEDELKKQDLLKKAQQGLDEGLDWGDEEDAFEKVDSPLLPQKKEAKEESEEIKQQ